MIPGEFLLLRMEREQQNDTCGRHALGKIERNQRKQGTRTDIERNTNDAVLMK